MQASNLDAPRFTACAFHVGLESQRFLPIFSATPGGNGPAFYLLRAIKRKKRYYLSL